MGDRVFGLHYLCVGLEVALRDDQVNQLLSNRHVRLLQRKALDQAEIGIPRLIQDRLTRLKGLDPVGAANRLQPIRISKIG